MNIDRYNSHSSNPTAKVAFVFRVIVLIALAFSCLMIIAKIRIAARNYHLKQQTISQKHSN